MREKHKNLAKAFEILTQMPKDFFAEARKDLPPQERESCKIRGKLEKQEKPIRK